MGEVVLDVTATVHQFAGLPAATVQQVQVFTVTDLETRPYTVVSEATIAPLAIAVVDWTADVAQAGVARRGSDLALVVRGEQARTASATVAFQSWFDTEGSQVDQPVARTAHGPLTENPRSEERRVGQECDSTVKTRWSPDHLKKNTTK